MKKVKLAFGTGSSVVVECCQICDFGNLEPILFLGYLPPVNTMPKIGTRPAEQPAYPAQWLYCPRCHLVQLGLIVDPKILFPPDYPYTSSTTKVLRENFAELYRECRRILKIGPDDLIVDIGSNDGNLLSNFVSRHRVLGVTPEDAGKIAIAHGIETVLDYFNSRVAKKILREKGGVTIVTATSVFAHMENIHEVLKNIISILKPTGVFISESHYLYSMIKTLQYDTIYHEHLRYYSLHSLKYLLSMHGLEIFYAKRIPPHGGSFRVYAARKGRWPIQKSVNEMLAMEKKTVTEKQNLLKFKDRIVTSKLELLSMLNKIKKQGKKVYGISAPSRGTTLVNYVGIDDGIVDAVMEIKGSNKIGRYIPGTVMPVLEESKLYHDQPDYALLLSWHIADELAPKIKQKGFRGDFIVPLPTPRILQLKS